MKPQNKKTEKIFSIVVLVILTTMALLKWFFGWCSIWLCVLFLAVVVAWSIISDVTNHEKSS